MLKLVELDNLPLSLESIDARAKSTLLGELYNIAGEESFVELLYRLATVWWD